MRHPRTLIALLLLAIIGRPAISADPPSTSLCFEVTVAKGLIPGPQDGRLLIVLGRKKGPAPRLAIGTSNKNAPLLLGRDVRGLAPGLTAVVDQSAVIFPLRHLADLPRGEYYAQAVFDTNRDLKLPNAPGNLHSEPFLVLLDPVRGGTVKLVLTRRLPEERLPAETESLKFVKLRSDLLSRFHGRPIYLRAGIILPAGYGRDPDRRYPLRIHIGGYGTRFTAVKDLMAPTAAFRKAWAAAGTPGMLLLHLDGSGPFGDPYQINSANNGPYGDAITRELIPHVEKKFRAIGRPHARVLDGTSTGGWVSLALQVFYPDFFNGAWAHAPDPVDFRAFQLVNIYADDNAYVNSHGFERPSRRALNGDICTTMRHECRLETVLGRGDRWTLSGKDWCAWNAAFGPRGDDGLPCPLWDGRTGKINRAVIEYCRNTISIWC